MLIEVFENTWAEFFPISKEQQPPPA
jgi:hypothetical protein